MTEKEVQLLGFERQDSNDYPEFYYYVYKVCDGLEFISCADSDVKEGEWFIEVFNTEPSIRFHKMEQVQSLINTLNKHIVK